MEIIAREMRCDEVAQVVETRNTHFPPIPVEDWYREEKMTAVVALEGDRFVGAIPLAIRKFQIAPGRIITAAYENAVLVIDGMRDRGIGTKMIEAAKKFLVGRCDALMVYRGHERSLGYNFYAKTGHVDLHYLEEYTVSNPTDWGEIPNVKITTDEDQFFAMEDEILRVFNSTFGKFGGFPPRGLGYWRKMVNGHIYAVHPTDFTYIWFEKNGQLEGYCICGRRDDSPNNAEYRPLQILEMAVMNNDEFIGLSLLKAVSTLAARQGCAWTMQGNNHPLTPLVKALGGESTPREKMSMIMGQLLTPEEFGRFLQDRPLLNDVEISIWTPKRDFVLKSTEKTPRAKVTLGMKEETMIRFLLGRVDLSAALKDERITVTGGNDTVLSELAEAFARHDWVYHHLDYI